MPRDGSGLYTLPAGNPVVSGTTIDVSWGNPTMSDIATALTDSLSRTGSGGMLVPFLNADGAVGSPGISWVNETTSGLYRAGGNDQRMASAGVDIVQFITDPTNPLKVFSGGAFRDVLNQFTDRTIAALWTLTNRLVTDDSTTVRAGLNVPLGVAPTVPVDGDIWTTGSNIFARIGGVTKSMIGATNVPISVLTNSPLVSDGAGGWREVGNFGNSGIFFNELTGSVQLFSSFLHANDSVTPLGTISSMTAGVNQVVATGAFLYHQWLTDHRFDGDIKILEVAAPVAAVAGYGDIWVRNDVPNFLMYTDDNGTPLALSIETGTFTGTLTGVVGTPTREFTYWKEHLYGQRYRVTILATDGSTLNGTSNSTGMTITGLPAALTLTNVDPQGARGVCTLHDNGAGNEFVGEFLYPVASSTLSFLLPNASGSLGLANFTAAGSKGVILQMPFVFVGTIP